MKKILLAFLPFLLFGCFDIKEESYKIEIVYNYQGMGIVALSPQKDSYEKGEEIVILSQPEYGYKFLGYDGLSEEEKVSKKIIVNEDRIIYANFTYSYFPSLEGINSGGSYKELIVDYKKDNGFEIILKIDEEIYEKGSIYNKEGNHTLKLMSKDKISNVEYVKLYSFTIDNTAPEIIFYEIEGENNFLFSVNEKNNLKSVTVNDEEVFNENGVYRYYPKVRTYENKFIFKAIDINDNIDVCEKIIYGEKCDPVFYIENQDSNSFEIRLNYIGIISKYIIKFQGKESLLEKDEFNVNSYSSTYYKINDIFPGNFFLTVEGYDLNNDLIGTSTQEIEIKDKRENLYIDFLDISYGGAIYKDNDLYYMIEEDYNRNFCLKKFKINKHEDENWYTDIYCEYIKPSPQFRVIVNNGSMNNISEGLINVEVFFNNEKLKEEEIKLKLGNDIELEKNYLDFIDGENILAFNLVYEDKSFYTEIKLNQEYHIIDITNEKIEISSITKNLNPFKIYNQSNNNYTGMERETFIDIEENYYRLNYDYYFYINIINKKSVEKPIGIIRYATTYQGEKRYYIDVDNPKISDLILEYSFDNKIWIKQDYNYLVYNRSFYLDEYKPVYLRFKNKYDEISESVYIELEE